MQEPPAIQAWGVSVPVGFSTHIPVIDGRYLSLLAGIYSWPNAAYSFALRHSIVLIIHTPT